MQDLADTIRKRFRESGLSIKALADRAGTPYANVHGLIVGDRDVTLGTASALVAVLGLELRPVQPRKGR